MNKDSTKQYVSRYLSDKIRVLSFLSIMLVLLIHSYNYANGSLTPDTIIHEGLNKGAVIEFYISNALSRFAVPLFFTISGYLSIVGVKKLTLEIYASKVSKRIVTLVAPYLFWVFFWTAFCFIIGDLFGWDRFPLLQMFNVWDSDPLNYIYYNPIAFQLWYLRDLFKLVVLLPLFYLFAKHLKQYSLLLFAIPWFMNLQLNIFPYPDAVLFFMLGCYIAVNNIDKKYLNQPVSGRKYLIIPVIWIIACGIYTYWAAVGTQPHYLIFAYKICVLLGLISITVIYDFIPERIVNSRISYELTSSAFLIFCIHEPLLTLILEQVLTPASTNTQHILVYFGLPVIFIVSSIILNKVLKRYAPELRSFLTGNR